MRSVTVQTQIAFRLRQALIQGQFQPGEALKLRDIARRFGTSMQPVREVIKQLVAEQALEALPNRSARIPMLSREKLEDLIQVRIAVEGLAAALAAKHVKAQDIDKLRKLLNRQPKDEVEHIVRHRDFHFILYRVARSTTLLPIIERLWLQLGPYLRLATHNVRSLNDTGLKYHYAVIDALERRDAKAARKAIEMDIRGSAALFSVKPAPQSAANDQLRISRAAARNASAIRQSPRV